MISASRTALDSLPKKSFVSLSTSWNGKRTITAEREEVITVGKRPWTVRCMIAKWLTLGCLLRLWQTRLTMITVLLTTNFIEVVTVLSDTIPTATFVRQ